MKSFENDVDCHVTTSETVPLSRASLKTPHKIIWRYVSSSFLTHYMHTFCYRPPFREDVGSPTNVPIINFFVQIIFKQTYIINKMLTQRCSQPLLKCKYKLLSNIMQ
jgi:hypothetical protein